MLPIVLLMRRSVYQARTEPILINGEPGSLFSIRTPLVGNYLGAWHRDSGRINSKLETVDVPVPLGHLGRVLTCDPLEYPCDTNSDRAVFAEVIEREEILRLKAPNSVRP